MPRTLTVTPGRDNVPGGRSCAVRLTTTSGDPDYDGLTVDIAGTVTNVDIPGVTVTPTTLPLDTAISEPSATYELVLDTMPMSDVTITPTTTASAITVSGPVTFTPDTWDQPQTVTLTAPSDTTARTAVINHDVTADDPAYRTLAPDDVHVAVGDPTTTITLTANPDQLTTTRPATVTATLAAEVGTPTGSVVFRVNGTSLCDLGIPDCDTDIVDGVASFNAGLLPVGTTTVTAAYAGDATHRAATASIELDVAAVTPEPVDDSVTIAEDAGLTEIDVVANDTDADALRISDYTQPAHGEVTCAIHSCSYTPDDDFHGTDTFTYTVTEGTRTASAIVTITVEPVNDPALDAIADATVVEGDTLSLTATALDPDAGDTVTFSLTAAPAGATIDPASGEITWTTSEADGPGTYPFTVRATDSTSLFDEESFTTTVDEDNQAPVADADAEQSVAAAAPVDLDGTSSSDADLPTHTLTYTWTIASAPAGSTASLDDATTATPSFTPDVAGNYPINLVVSDGTDTATDTVTITATAINGPPTVAVAARGRCGRLVARRR